MSGGLIAFFILAILTLGGAFFMLNFTKVVHMAISMALTFLSIAGLFVLLEAEFIAFVQVMIYTGAITIIALFGIMLTRHDTDDEEKKRPGHKFFVFILAAVLFGFLFMGINGMVSPSEAQLAEQNTSMIGQQLFTNYVIPFELASILLLVAMMGAIIIAKREADK
ncbi:NADH-quinone oxidoreductase subunit J [Microaerobacter geothermalis]|uniref:NADH-quinone oxidoreductase subunit J n=1 Tax=Microaerobacter geothermalis TaxID=674972 RepID=UPI001F3B12A1|nr:NADH-quinone oxidoreductase subunit J [Microaerobacter geothermalis]MCF6093233.1 NADH-quinone oxidoreductase subunit J [Microaerobacter geothermalis]